MAACKDTFWLALDNCHVPSDSVASSATTLATVNNQNRTGRNTGLTG
jgi:hypothetical protein